MVFNFPLRKIQNKDCRHRKKHDADRYCSYNLLILLGPVTGRVTFYEYIKIGAAVYGLQPFFYYHLYLNHGMKNRDIVTGRAVRHWSPGR